MGRKRGFTLMEMLAVVAVLAIAAAIVVPAVGFLRDSWIMRQRNAQARTVFLAAQGRISDLRASGGLTGLEDVPDAVPQLGEILPEGQAYIATGDDFFGMILPEHLLEEGLTQARMILEFHRETGALTAVFYYEGRLDILEGYQTGRLPRDAKGRRKLLLGYYDGNDLPAGPEHLKTVQAELAFENGQDAKIKVRIPTQTKELSDLTKGDYTGFCENLEIYLTITGERGGEVRNCIKPRGTAEDCSPGSTEGGMDAVEVTALLDSLHWAGSLDGGIAPGDNVSVTAEISSDFAEVEGAVLPGISPLFGSLTEDGRGGLRINVTNGRHLQNLNKLAPALARKVSAVVFTGPEGIVGKGEGIRIDWQETSGYYGGLDFVPISNKELLETADFVGNETAICNLKIETSGDAGLFVFLNTAVDSLYVADPEITGGGSVGALAGWAGEQAVITNCACFCEDSAAVRGQTAGGLVGTVEPGASFARCFGAVPVEGDISGGFAGAVSGGDFDRCYASGTVLGAACSGGFLGSGEDAAFANCFATGDVYGTGAVGGFAGTLTAGTGMQFHSCYSLGLSQRNGEIFESFCGETLGNTAGLSDYYKGYAEACLAEAELTDYRFKDCYYLSGNCPAADYDNGASAFWANPVDYETLGNIRNSGSLLLERLMAEPFETPEKLEKVKEFLNSQGKDLTEILEKYEDYGTYQIYFDAGKVICGDTSLKKAYRKAYSAAFPGRVWETGESTFPVLKGVPYYGTWPNKISAGDFGVLYYEKSADGLNLRQISLADGRETASRSGSGPVTEAGYGLYFTPGTRPFGEETWAMAGETLEGILPGSVTVLALDGNSTPDEAGKPVPLRISARYWGNSVTVVPEFADTLNRTGETFTVRCQRQLEAVARYPGLDYVLEGEIRLDESFTAIPEFGGSLTGTGEVIFDNSAGFVEILSGGTLENIQIRGSLTLSGTAGALASRVTEGGTIRDCSVNCEINLKNPEIFGPVVGILEDGSILRTRTEAKVSGTAACQGSFLGQALGGRIRDCQAAVSAEDPAFAGFAASQEIPVENATHFTPEKPKSSRVAADALTALAVPAALINYTAEFENCTYQIGANTLDILETRHFCCLNPMGGWNQTLWDSDELPTFGTFLLVTEAGERLTVKNGLLFRKSRWDLAGLTASDFWQVDDGWHLGDFRVTVEAQSEGRFAVSWQESVAVRWMAEGESEPRTWEENAVRRVICILYQIAKNTDCRAVWLETGRLLRRPGEGL